MAAGKDAATVIREKKDARPSAGVVVTAAFYWLIQAAAWLLMCCALTSIAGWVIRFLPSSFVPLLYVVLLGVAVWSVVHVVRGI